MSMYSVNLKKDEATRGANACATRENLHWTFDVRSSAVFRSLFNMIFEQIKNPHLHGRQILYPSIRAFEVHYPPQAAFSLKKASKVCPLCLQLTETAVQHIYEKVDVIFLDA